MIDGPVSDLSRSIQHEPNMDWPSTVKLELHWWVAGRPRIRTVLISSDQFFGRGEYGAPMDGTALIGVIENMRRAGPPPSTPQRKRPHGNKKIR